MINPLQEAVMQERATSKPKERLFPRDYMSQLTYTPEYLGDFISWWSKDNFTIGSFFQIQQLMPHINQKLLSDIGWYLTAKRYVEYDMFGE